MGLGHFKLNSVWKVSGIPRPDNWKLKENFRYSSTVIFHLSFETKASHVKKCPPCFFSWSKYSPHSPPFLWLSTLFLILTSIKYSLKYHHSTTYSAQWCFLSAFLFSVWRLEGRGKVDGLNRQKAIIVELTNWSSRRVRIAVQCVAVGRIRHTGHKVNRMSM